MIPSRIQSFGYLFVFSAAFTNYVPLLHFFQRNARKNFVLNFYDLQMELEACALTGAFEEINMRLSNRVALAIIFVFSVALSSPGLNSKYSLTNIWRATGFFNEGIVLYWLVYTATFMKKMICVALQEFTLLREYNESGKNSKKLSELLLRHRKIWLHILVKIKLAGNVLSLSAGTLLLVNFGRSLYSVFMILENEAARELSVYLLYSFSPILVVCHFCHSVEQKVLALNIFITCF
ncbi:Hypothetical predicted protein [Cloeon dipterum]|uniref:Uncharacterized protein n=1 Tax=Cloeon dipterum TaxID=197152 RepID=A0A8S1D0S2_9INSE|nr:Hypothetical predicted protein [Cloeon dipterum]